MDKSRSLEVPGKKVKHLYFIIGRSSGDGTFQINMTKMTELSVNENDPLSPTGKSVTTGTGNNYGTIYKKVGLP